MADFSTRSNGPERTTAQPGIPIGRFRSSAEKSVWKDFFSNLKYFLAERRIKEQGGSPAVFVPQRFGDGTGSNLKELFRAAPRGDVDSDLLVNWNSGFGSLFQNVRDAFFPKKFPPLQTDSRPVAVKEIWSSNTQFTRLQALSMVFHVVVLVLIILPLGTGFLSPATTKASSRSLEAEARKRMPNQVAASILMSILFEAGGTPCHHVRTPLNFASGRSFRISR
jgi:hypothetical protein